MHVHGFAATDVGQQRDHNEDSFMVDDDLGLYIVCDGVGGHAAGEVASALAVETVRDFMKRHRATLKKTAEGAVSLSHVSRLVEEAIQKACQTVYDQAHSSHEHYGMGTTITLLLRVGDRGIMGHVGDSSLYMYRNGYVHKLSDDHTFVAELIRNGVLEPENAANSPYSNVLTRALGKTSSVQVDILELDLIPDDVFMLCSDGLSNYLNESKELGGFLGEDELQNVPELLIAIANHRGGSDNITCVIVQACIAEDEDDDVEMQRSTEFMLRVDTLQSVYLFRGLSMKEIAQVLSTCHDRRYNPKDVIIKGGEACASISIILMGSVSVWRKNTRLADLGPGSHIGEMSCLQRRPAIATVVAEEVCRCLEVGYNELELVMQQNPRLGLKIMTNLSQQLATRLDETNRQLSQRNDDQDNESKPHLWI